MNLAEGKIKKKKRDKFDQAEQLKFLLRVPSNMDAFCREYFQEYDRRIGFAKQEIE